MSQSRSSKALYAIMAVPLAFAGLPIYVYAPKFYTDHFAVDLGLIGAVLIACRLLDAVQDPLFGWVSDRYFTGLKSRAVTMIAAAAVMCFMFAALFLPGLAFLPEIAWFTLALILTFSAYSLLYINYYALGAEYAPGYHHQATLSLWREAAGLIGILLATLLPVLLTQTVGELKGYAYYAAALAVITFIACMAILRLSKDKEITSSIPRSSGGNAVWQTWKSMMANDSFRWLGAIFLLNTIAASIPAVLVLYYVEDVLGAKESTGLFLAVYFISGAAGMPFWQYALKRIGKKNTWLLSMLMAVAAFAWAFFLREGDAMLFVLVCFFSGAALGADLAIPPAMLTDAVPPERNQNGNYFGLWAFLTKLAFALASGLSLILLDMGGYSGNSVEAGHVVLLAATYALLPCVFKLTAAILLWYSPLDQKYAENLSYAA